MNLGLIIKDLNVCVEDKKILNGINLEIKPGEIHTIMGPNGSGKSSLAFTIAGSPKYKIEKGSIKFANQEINNLSADKRAKLGILLAFQMPYEIEGITLFDFLYTIYNNINKEKKVDLKTFKELLDIKCKSLKIKEEFLNRPLNFGFSGGEKKVAEILQISLLNPKLIILDEIDSGLDVDALKNVCENLLKIKSENPSISFLIITHYPRILHYLDCQFVHVMQNGKIIKTAGKDLAFEIEKEGF
ncbi:TPA: Fe-S cluster assembly ATPase SufC [Candidatus Dependentiae bacterium]|nr:MAG: FeS assembly ATPase SufC [candidate division TM6 bacterium GW2011_GWE2_31_21]KKP53159.1 MAG: FeS assembly ATPase SufC [candidate division TM6 bacterium GW2011_GWF2_33_332]HBS47979.1 Fe-S cluster assembly ATPase SufC [Candidatus Dependentiae bacterium]HBZ73417.1 Fe-S cluster assembly ATPase SufC [Candidatus Dependentiae bacterium]